ncbi:pyridoxamine 5'-phosphate oxidase family protein [Saccharopolyspora taberi]|uniref:Pyridoxamine 5'-phosphate oxidase family protein n=1 Tax=Saccharopolyspora taberi TaxID=60895 RepID=A0ABN3V9Q6_9PSEU
MSRFARLVLTEQVRRMQLEQGSRPPHRPDLGEQVGRTRDPLGERETGFIAARDGFYLGSVGETGWPYVQFRGGPPGFVHVLDPLTIAFAEVRGNRQYLTSGNLRTDSRVSLFFMDYAHRTRLKLLGHARLVGLDEDPELTGAVCAHRTDGRVERIMVVAVEGHDWNCPKHIPRRYPEAAVSELRDRVQRLEAENAELRRQLER